MSPVSQELPDRERGVRENSLDICHGGLDGLPGQRRATLSGSPSFSPLLSLALASETFIQGLQLPGRHITPSLPPTLPCPSEVPDGLVQGSWARFVPCSILPTSGLWGARRRAWQGGRWWVGRRGCPADGRLSGQMANWVGVRSSPICFCPCRAFLSTFGRVRIGPLDSPWVLGV